MMMGHCRDLIRVTVFVRAALGSVRLIRQQYVAVCYCPRYATTHSKDEEITNYRINHTLVVHGIEQSSEITSSSLSLCSRYQVGFALTKGFGIGFLEACRAAPGNLYPRV